MRMICYNIKGERIEVPPTATPQLLISWSRAFDEVYCHHALLKIPENLIKNISEQIAIVSLHFRLNVIEKGEVKSFSDKTLSRFFPFKKEGNDIIIPLNSVEILEGLCENGWTTLKGGKRGAPKSFPLSISVMLENNREADGIVFSFMHNEGKFPFTICEYLFKDLSNYQKIDTAIFL